MDIQPTLYDVDDSVVVMFTLPKEVLENGDLSTVVVGLRGCQMILAPAGMNQAQEAERPSSPTKGRFRRTYSAEMRREVVERMLTEGISANRMSKESGASQPSISKWRKDFIEDLLKEGKTPEELCEQYKSLSLDSLRKWEAKMQQDERSAA